MMIQDYSRYTPDDQLVWTTLYNRQLAQLPGLASSAFLNGIRSIGFESDVIPRFSHINDALGSSTGWKIYAVPGLIPNKEFFEALLECRFPATTWFRRPDQLNYLEEPDMFHDVFGHVPLLTNHDFCRFLSGLAQIALRYIDDELAIELISRLYWYTVEFGLIMEGSELKIYGSGILSSAGESQYCVGPVPVRVPFGVREIMETPYIKDRYQEKYWVIQSYAQLYESVPLVERELENLLAHQQTAR